MLPAWWVDDTVRGAPDGAEAFLAGGGLPPGHPADPHYRNCWWVDDPGLPFYHASGINGQHIFVHAPSQTVVAKLSTWPTALSPWRDATGAGVLAIAAELERTT